MTAPEDAQPNADGSDDEAALVVEVVDGELVEVPRAAVVPAQPTGPGHPRALFWLNLALLIPAGFAADAADGRPPGVATR
jgi:hypothetical protein